MRVIRKYHNHTPQNKPHHGVEEPQNTDCHKTTERQLSPATTPLFPIEMISKLDGHKVLNNKQNNDKAQKLINPSNAEPGFVFQKTP